MPVSPLLLTRCGVSYLTSSLSEEEEGRNSDLRPYFIAANPPVPSLSASPCRHKREVEERGKVHAAGQYSRFFSGRHAQKLEYCTYTTLCET